MLLILFIIPVLTFVFLICIRVFSRFFVRGLFRSSVILVHQESTYDFLKLVTLLSLHVNLFYSALL